MSRSGSAPVRTPGLAAAPSGLLDSPLPRPDLGSHWALPRPDSWVRCYPVRTRVPIRRCPSGLWYLRRVQIRPTLVPLGLALLSLGCAEATGRPCAPSAETAPSPQPSSEAGETSTFPAAPELPAPRAQVRAPRRNFPWLGAFLKDQGGVRVFRVLRGSPAARAGLAEDDIIVSAERRPLRRSRDLIELLQERPVHAELALEVERRGARRIISVPLEPAPVHEDIARLELVGFEAPEISGVVTFQGDVSSLRELAGRVVLLEFWASYCGACRLLAPELEKWHVEYSGRGLSIVGVTVDPLKLGAEVARKLRMTYSLASDPAERVTNRYLAREIPMLVLIDRKGEVRDVAIGPSPERMRQLEHDLRELLREST